MTLALVVATEAVAAESTPTAGLALRGGSVAGRLLEQLESLGVADRRVIARPEHAGELQRLGCEVIESKGLADDLREIARIVRGARRPVLILHGDVVAHGEVLARLVFNSKAPASAAATRVPSISGAPNRPVMRIRRGRIVSAGTPYHQVTDPNALFRGVLRVAAEQTGALAAAAERLAELADIPDGLTEISPVRVLWQTADEPQETAGGDVEAENAALPPVLGSTPVTGDDAPALLLAGLVRSGVKVTARGSHELVCERVLDQAQATAAQQAVDAVDEDRVRLDAAVKNNDGFFTTYAVSTYSRYIARWCARHGWTPNAVTAISMAISVVAAAWFATGHRWGMVIGAVFFYFAFVFDCVDGQLARYSRQFSTLGAWLDATFDRAKEYTVFAGLAAGSTAARRGQLGVRRRRLVPRRRRAHPPDLPAHGRLRVRRLQAPYAGGADPGALAGDARRQRARRARAVPPPPEGRRAEPPRDLAVRALGAGAGLPLVQEDRRAADRRAVRAHRVHRRDLQREGHVPRAARVGRFRRRVHRRRPVPPLAGPAEGGAEPMAETE